MAGYTERCGISVQELNEALAESQGEINKAQEYFHRASKIIDERNLTFLQRQQTKLRQKLNDSSSG